MAARATRRILVDKNTAKDIRAKRIARTKALRAALPKPDVAAATIDVAEDFKKLFNPDGTVSTVRTISFDEDGVEVLIPTVVGGKLLTNEQAVELFRRSGRHFGKFSSVQRANDFAAKLHDVEASKP